jgi:outer membrane protein assembly factor BamB
MTATALCACLAQAAVFGADGDWPYWRGPSSTGVARGDAPLTWSATERIAWKAEIPGRGFSSPVVWGNRVFVTTAVPVGGGGGARALGEHRFLVICVDRQTGKQLWEHEARVATPHEGYHFQYGSFASISPVTDGSHLIAYFGSRGLFAYTLDGKLVWQKDLGQLRMYQTFGEGNWPLLAGSTLLIVFDHESESALIAFDKATGRELWRTPRQGNTNWSGPYVTTHNGRRQVIVSASREVVGYDLETGKRIWHARGLGQNTIPAPVATDGLVTVMSGFRNPNLLTIRLGREGDLTDTDAIVWQNQRGNSYTASPVLHDGKLYVLTDSGQLTCWDMKTGKAFYQQQRLPKAYNFKASPVAANGKLYLASEEGDVIVVKMGDTFEVLATNTIPGETFIATPAIVDGGIYLRGKNTLYAIR